MTYEAILCETTTLRVHNSERIDAYFARPLGPGPFPGVVVIHHMRDAGHAFFAVDRPQYRVHAALDGWKRIFAWFDKYLP